MADSGSQAAARGGSSKKLRFSVTDNIWLLREVVIKNPYEDSARWGLITDALNRASGTEEQYSEREVLLQEVADLVRSFPPAKKNKQSQNAAKATATMQLDGAAETWAAAEAEMDFLGWPERVTWMVRRRRDVAASSAA
ncbi:hypothetical protein HPB47_016246 [Ixodes persulcatus]|uniref:Uncharacterized protein n=1 Tax=Ixodes persulcatus TaxID=34615 RepID=A0AC60QSA0_IXOPE|nr:hypothetical protein HPB47_016246 [Ixodes persulcatus]